MDLLILGSLLLTGGLLSLAGVFDGGDDNADNSDPEPPEINHGTWGDDTLNGDKGLLSGWGGDDTLNLSGSAEGHGDEGDDTIHASSQDAASYGGAGNDTLDGSANFDAHGGDGNDDLVITSGGSGWGDAGNDLLVADGTATADGGTGDDLLLAAGHATLTGGEGNDTFLAAFPETGILTISDFDASHDHLGLTLPDGTTLGDINLQVTADDGAGYTDIALQLGSQTAHIHLQGVADFDPAQLGTYEVTQATGSDHLTATLHDQLQQGGDGNDSILATDGTTLVRGGDGDNTIYGEYSFPNGLELFGGAGNDIVSGETSGTYGGDGDDTLTGAIGTLYGGSGNDVVTDLADASAYGGVGDDHVFSASSSAYGGGGNDILGGNNTYGGAGNDVLTVNANSGEDRFEIGTAEGGAGNDSLSYHGNLAWGSYGDLGSFSGGAGNDLISVEFGAAVDGGAGSDSVVITAAPNALFVAYAAQPGVSDDYYYTQISLGGGDDLVAIGHGIAEDSDGVTTYTLHTTIADFSDTDQLALIMTEAERATAQISLSHVGNDTLVHVVNAANAAQGIEAMDIEIRLQGVGSFQTDDIRYFSTAAQAEAAQAA